MKFLKFWLCFLLLFALSLSGVRDSHAGVVLTLSKPAPKPVLALSYRVTERKNTWLRGKLSISNRQKTWYYVDARKAGDFYSLPSGFILGPLQTRIVEDAYFEPSQSGSFVADSTSKYKQVSYALGIEATYRVGMGTLLPTQFGDALEDLLTLLAKVQAKDPSVPAAQIADATRLLASLNTYGAALKKKDVSAASKALQGMVSNPALVEMLSSVSQQIADKYKTNIAKLTPNSAKFLSKAGAVVNAQLTALNAPSKDVATYSTTFEGPAPKLIVSDVRAREGDATHDLVVPVKLSSPWWEDIEVVYSTANGTAKVGQDYKVNFDHLIFRAGKTIPEYAKMEFSILGDPIVESDESFKLRFSTSSKALIIPKNLVTITLINDDKVTTTPSNSGKIAYSTGSNIYVMNADGTNKTRLTDDGQSFSPTFFFDGSKIAFTSWRDGGSKIYVMNADGTNQKVLADVGGGYIRLSSAAISPDGSKIAFTTHEGYDNIFPLRVFVSCYIMNADGTNVIGTNFIDDSYHHLYDYAFSPDGSKIVQTRSYYDSIDGDIGSPDIYVMNADGTSHKQLTADDTSNFNPSFSPDGSKIVFTSSRNGYDELYVMNADGTNQTRMKTKGYDASFSPDGSKIAFVNGGIRVMNADGTKQTFLAEGNAPSWAPGSVPAPSTAASSPASRSASPSGGAS